MIDVLGYFAGACLIASMLLRNIYAVKALILITAICFLIYGIILDLVPIIVINILLTASGVFELIRLSRKGKGATSTS